MLAYIRLSRFLHCQTSLKRSPPLRLLSQGRGQSTQHSPNFWEGLFAQILAGFVLSGICTGKYWCGEREQKVVATWVLDGSVKALIICIY